MDKLLDTVGEVARGLSAGELSSYSLISALCWAVLSVVRGDWGFRIPGVSERLQRWPRGQTTAAVVGLGVVGGVAGSIGLNGLSGSAVANGLYAGVATALGAAGLNSATTMLKTAAWQPKTGAPAPAPVDKP